MSPDLPVRNPRFGFTGGADDFECEDYGCPDAFVAKLTPGGRSLIYATYLAGSRLDEGSSIAVDAAGNAYVVGRTNSEDFPAGGNPQTVSGGHRAFVVKFAPGGALEWTRYVRRSSRYTPAGVALDGAGHVYVSGATDDEFFETTSGAHDRQCVDPRYNDNCTDSFVARFTTGGTLLATTLFGGDFPDERADAIAIDRAGRPVIAGGVGAPMYGFPRTPGAYGTTPEPSGEAAFVARLSADLSRLEWAAAYGGRDGDHVLGLTLDAEDRPVVVGWTDSRDYPTTPGAIDRQCNNSDEWYSCPGMPDGFATKLTADGTGLVWSTYLGGFSRDVAHAVTNDAAGGVAVAGATSNAETFPLRDAFQSQVRHSEEMCPGPWPCGDAFLVRLGAGGELLHGTVLGGDGMEEARGVAVDTGGRAWIGGTAFSDDLPVTADAMQPARAGAECPLTYHQFPNCSDGLLAAFGPSAPGSSPPATISAGTTSSSGATTARRMTLVRRGRRISGRVTGCTARARIVLERRSPGRWRVVRRLRTRADGLFAFRLPARAGRYRLRAPCAGTRSRVISLR
jgi:beta-propeller repeat-containing protein